MALLFPRNSCQWQIGLTKSFRNSSRKIGSDKRPMFGASYGSNLQNPDKTICGIYKPDEGKIFVQVDQAGAEALIVAYECQDGNFRALFKNKIKPHTYVSLHQFKDKWKALKPEWDIEAFCNSPINQLRQLDNWKLFADFVKETDNWPASRRYYFMSKCGCHAGNYRIGPSELQVNMLLRSDGEVVISLKEATDFLILYNQKLFPEIPRWQFRIADLVKNTKVLRNLFGYPRYFADIFTDQYWKDALSWIPQSTVGVITHKAIASIQRFIETENLDWDILNNKHDSYLVQCPIGDELECAKKMKEFIELDLVSSTGVPFKMASEAQVGYNWKPYNAETNPEGMKEIKV